MESAWLLLVFLAVMFAAYRLATRRLAGPQTIVHDLLRHYHAFEGAGHSEQERLLRVLMQRRGWNKMPHPFLVEVVKRLRTKEDVFRFVSVVEGYQFDRKQLPAIARKPDPEAALREVAEWLTDFGGRMQRENRFKEAEFVQKLALALQPDRYTTRLPLAVTYYRMGRYAEAIPLFEQGLSQLKTSADRGASLTGPGENAKELTANYEEMYETSLKAAGNKPPSSMK